MAKANRYKLKALLLNGYSNGASSFDLSFDNEIIPLPVISVITIIADEPAYNGDKKTVVAIPGSDFRNTIFIKENTVVITETIGEPSVSIITLRSEYTNDLSLLGLNNIDLGALEISGKIKFNLQNSALSTSYKYLFHYLEKF